MKSATRKPKKRQLTHERAVELLKYNPDTGILTWKVKSSRKTIAGMEVGSLNGEGYRMVSIDNVDYYVHRLIWFLVKGYWPNVTVDHDNTIKSDNRLVNLREATYSQNNANIGLRKDNTTGVRGVRLDKRRNRYVAEISMNGKAKYLGQFRNKEEAAAARLTAEREIHGEFAYS